ncbi:hypothetical protein DSO57_1004795 [Entomophthora muscae]|uniref:Uncharacterized protein n=1 Tax=Entomophthora muscae TaxID=34485 RepID=A0ACC2UTH6_9FUNG|nr:hypothetical protein DSO57_1004795 [Entomophthora muscae]
MSLKSTLVVNQDSSPEENAGLKPASMIMAQEQKNQEIFPEVLTNKKMTSSSVILLLLNPGVLATQPHISQSYNEPYMENVKFGGRPFVSLLFALFFAYASTLDQLGSFYSSIHNLIVDSFNPPSSSDHFLDLEINFLTKLSVIKTGLYFIFLGSLISVAIANFAHLFLSTRSPGLPAPLPAVYQLPGAPFEPVHFTEYLLKPEYKEYTLEKILEQDPWPA